MRPASPRALGGGQLRVPGERAALPGPELPPCLTSTWPESEAALATDVVKTLSAAAPTLATVTVVTSATQEPDSAPARGQRLPGAGVLGSCHSGSLNCRARPKAWAWNAQTMFLDHSLINLVLPRT